MKSIRVIALASLCIVISGCTLVSKTQKTQKDGNKTVVNTQYSLFGLSTPDVSSPGIPGMLVPIYSSEETFIDTSSKESLEASPSDSEEANK